MGGNELFFNTLFFWLLFGAFYLVYWSSGLSSKARVRMLLVANLAFYTWLDPKYLPCIIAMAWICHFASKRIAASTDQAVRKRILTFCLIAVLVLLGIFRYSNFVAENVSLLLGIDYEPLFRSYPIGMIFYTCAALSFPIDVYRKQAKADSDLVTFSAAVSFFPVVTSGPIIRPKKFLPQLESIQFNWTLVSTGFLFIAVGLFKKTLADIIGLTIEDLYSGDEALSMAEAWLASLGFASRLYLDFSGYSEIAIGAGALLGFEVPRNFKMPYLSPSPIELWKRWHITLSLWIRDYLFLSVGIRTPYRSLLVAWAVGGLLHGAGWTFLVWGFYQAALLIGATYLKSNLPLSRKQHKKLKFPKIVLTLYLWCIGCALFNSPSLDRAWDIISAMHWSSVASVLTFPLFGAFVLAIVGSVLGHVLDWTLSRDWQSSFRMRVTYHAVATACLAGALVLEPTGGGAFIYMTF